MSRAELLAGIHRALDATKERLLFMPQGITPESRATQEEQIELVDRLRLLVSSHA